MNRYKEFGKKIIAISLMAMMIFVGIGPIEFGAYAETEPYTVTWMNYDGSEVLDTYTATGEDKSPVYSKETPTWTEASYKFTFVGWATEALSSSGTSVDKLPAIPQEGVTYYAAFSKTLVVDAPKITKKTAGFQKVYLEWSKVDSPNGATVYYQVQEVATDGKGAKESKIIYNGTDTKLTPDFDPYPGKANGEAKYGNKAASGTARTVTYNVRAYVKDGSSTYYSSWATTGKIEVVHPMYVIVKVKGKAKILKNSSTSKSVGKTKKNGYYVAFGGSRIKGEKKRVIIKVNGENRYISVGNISKFKYVYKSRVGKDYYKGKAGYCYSYSQIEQFVTDYDKTKKSNKWSKKNFGIYVDTYHQRAYLLKKSGSVWKVATDYQYHDLAASTGRQLSPYGGYRVANTMAKKKTTGTKWWLLFNHIGIHEKLSEKLGKPASGGCIRVPDPASKWFFDNIKKGTGVFIY